jgi:aldehyde dehydrogenase
MPALAAGNCVVLKPAEQTPLGILAVMELIADILPPGVVNVVNGFGIEAGKPLAQNKRVAKIAFTGETTTGRMIMQYASDNSDPCNAGTRRQVAKYLFRRRRRGRRCFLDKALEGFAMFALNQGEVCTCPSRVLVQESIYDKFMEKAVARTKKIKQGHPLDASTMIGAQASNDQLEKILSYLDIGKQEGAKVLTGGKRATMEGELAEGYYVEPTIFEGNNKMRIFQEEIFGPVVSVTKFRTRMMHSRSPTILFTGSALGYGLETATAPTGSAAPSRPGVFGPIATTPIPRTRHSAGTSSPASVVKPTK